MHNVHLFFNLCDRQGDEFLRLAINGVHNDLTSRNEAFECLALSFIGSGALWGGIRDGVLRVAYPTWRIGMMERAAAHGTRKADQLPLVSVVSLQWAARRWQRPWFPTSSSSW